MRNDWKIIGRVAALWLAVSALPAMATPFGLTYGGRLKKTDGSPVSGTVTMSVQFFDAAKDGNKLGLTYTIPNVALSDGVFSIRIPASDAELNDLMSSAASPWIQVRDETNKVDYDRQLFTAVPYALKVPVDPNVLKYDATGHLTLSAPPENGKYLSAAAGALQWVSAPTTGGINDQSNGVAMTIDSQERVAIGTTNFDSQYRTVISSPTSESPLRLAVNQGANSSTFQRIVGFTNEAFTIEYGSIRASSDALQVVAGNATNLILSTSQPTSHVLLQPSGGNVGIGTTQPLSQLHLANASIGGDATYHGNLIIDSKQTENATNGIEFKASNGAAGYGYRFATVYDGAAAIDLKVQRRKNTATWSDALVVEGDAGYVGIGSASPADALDVNGNIRATNFKTIGLTRTMTPTYSTVDIGTFTLTSGAGNLRVTVTVPSPSFSVSKTYELALGYDQTLGSWAWALPFVSSGPYSSNDFELYVKVSGATAALRIYRTSGITSGTAYITIEQNGVHTDPFVPSTAVTAFAQTYFLPSALLTQTNTGVGIGVTNPTAPFHVGVNSLFEIGEDTNGFAVHNGPNDEFQIRVDGDQRMTLLQESYGTVGIGTSSAKATLDVNGFMKLSKNSGAPVTCDLSHDGSLALASTYKICVCRNGTGWVFTSDGTTACVW